jgi:enoyl-CoA hydratase/carnithine racemase
LAGSLRRILALNAVRPDVLGDDKDLIPVKQSSAANRLDDSPLRRHDEAGVATLTLDYPASRNALSQALIDALTKALAEIAAEPAIRAVIIAGQGPVFSSGHDLREIQAHRNDPDSGKAYYEELMRSCSALMQAIVRLSKPIIAAVEGVATAAGCQLVAACDLAIAGENARFATPGVNIGLFCSTPLVAVGRAISTKHAMEMALTGALYPAREAERFGLINRVVAAGQAYAEALRLAAGIAARSPAAVAIGKQAFYAQRELNLAQAYDLASRAMVENLMHADSSEGISAFLERREPNWRGK